MPGDSGAIRLLHTGVLSRSFVPESLKPEESLTVGILNDEL